MRIKRISLDLSTRRPAAGTVTDGVGYLIVTAAAAWAVFTKIGVGRLRRAWFNLDRIWEIALIVNES
jgi:hypothetical protein